ncbi:NrsF family protein [Paraburkholderia sp. SIMBA_030]|uniref:NrsF family protein n=1 Tax=Paraburkholderia sp. SIMBA_030 TaxID=3085773 RepID=UPI003979E522
MRTTSSLIDSLVADVKPVRRLGPPSVRAVCWLLFAMSMLVLVALGHGVRPDLMLKLHQPAFVIGVAAALITGALAALASFIVSVPGRSSRWLLLPVPALAVWLSTIGYGCLTNWVSIGPDGMSPGETARCFATLALTGIPLSLTMLIMLRHVARLAPTPIAMMASLAVAAMTAVALSLFHPIDATVMILLWNFGVAVLFLTISGLGGRRLFGWVALKG